MKGTFTLLMHSLCVPEYLHQQSIFPTFHVVKTFFEFNQNVSIIVTPPMQF